MFGGARTSCSDKSKHRNDDKYVCDETTGFRWRLRPEFRKCSDNEIYANHPDLYECNDITKRWRLKEGARALPRTKCSDTSKFKNDPLYECGEETDYRWMLKNEYRRVRADGAPKRPLSSYMLWVNANRHLFKSEGKKASEVAKDMGVVWKSLSAEEKAPYIAQAFTEMTNYMAAVKEHKKHNGSLYHIIDTPKRKKPDLSYVTSWKRAQKKELGKLHPDWDKKHISRVASENWHKRLSKKTPTTKPIIDDLDNWTGM